MASKQVSPHHPTPVIVLGLSASSCYYKIPKSKPNYANYYSTKKKEKIPPNDNCTVRFVSPHNYGAQNDSKTQRDDKGEIPVDEKTTFAMSGNNDKEMVREIEVVGDEKCEQLDADAVSDTRLVRKIKIPIYDDKKVVSPYFASSDGKSKRKKSEREHTGSEGRVVSSDLVMIDKKRKKTREAQSDQTYAEFENLGKPLLGQSQNDGHCYVEDRSSPRLVSLGLKGKADNPHLLVKREDIEEKKCARELLVSLINGDEERVVSPFFVKSGHKVKDKERKTRKKQIQSDQSHGEDEAEAFDVTSRKTVSPYFMKEETKASGNSESECLKEAEKKVRKLGKNKKLTCQGDEILETEAKKPRKSKKKITSIDQCCMDQNDGIMTLVLGLPTVVSSGLKIKVENEATHESTCRQSLIDQRKYKAGVGQEDQSGQVDINKDCADHGEAHEATSSCFGNAKRKRVKPLHKLKIDKSEDDLTINGDRRGCDVIISCSNRKVVKKKKQMTASQKCEAATGQENDAVPSSMGYRKEEMTHDSENYQKASAAKGVSPYFQKLFEEHGRDDDRDETNCESQKKRRVTRTVNLKFEELLSNFAYKGGSHMNREEEHGLKKEDGSAGKGKKKGKKPKSVNILSAAQKRAEAYRKKTPDCTWRPPCSPYNLLQEEGTSSSSEVQLYQQFQRLEKEAQAMALQKHNNKPSDDIHKNKKNKLRADIEIMAGAGVSFQEMCEVFSYSSRPRRRRRSKQPKKRGRRKGSRNKLSPEITKMLGDATLHYAHARYQLAISLLTEVVRLAPNLPDPYHTLGLVFNSMGNQKKSVDCYMIAAFLGPKHSSLWKLLVTWSIEQENIGQAWYCLNKAITADPTDVTLRYHRASLSLEAGDYSKAAESYDQIVQICPDNVEAIKTAATLYKQSGQFERSIIILEDYLNKHPSEADLTVVDMLALSFMENSLYTKALQHIEYAKQVYGFEKEFPLCLKVREGICHAHLGNMEKAEICFSLLQRENAEHQMDFIMEVANAFSNLHQNELALKYYLMLEGCISKNELISLKIAQCYFALKKATSAIQFFYKALQAREDDIDARLVLASLLLEENREDEAVELLTPPPNAVLSQGMHTDKVEPWWLNVRVKLKLSHIYRTRGMREAFVELIYPIVYESLKIDSMHQKAKQRKKLSMSELSERVKVLGDHQSDSVFGKFRRPASKNDLLKANRAKRLLEKRASSKEEKMSAAVAAGLDWESDDSEDDVPHQPLKEPPLPDLFKHEEHYDLISDLCIALTSLRRYSDALELIKLTLKITYKTLPAEKKEKFQSLGAQIALNVTDPSDGFDYVRYIVQQRPQSVAAWNCYYRLVLRLENRLSKHNKFLHHMRVEHKDLVPPMIISGNQFTMISQHQVAAREYLEAYKQMPDSPLVNLCAGTALVNLALGHRLQNKHQCLAQGLAFLYINLRLCENSQEALYNIARAYHHVGLVSLAATYYEKVLAIPQEDCPLPELIKVDKDLSKGPKSGHCDLRREAAYNLHLIYKRSGAFDLARQILRDYCTL